MNILYIHGFGSKYDPEHEKIKTLESIGTVFGVDVDYTRGFRSCFETIMDVFLTGSVDLVVGTSMGGYMASHVGAESGTPFVAINPAIEPSVTLQKYLGTHENHAGDEFTLTESAIATYPDMMQEGFGLVLLDRGDEVISASKTESLLGECHNVVTFQGGCHRFSHMADSLPAIEAHYNTAQATYGVTND